MNLLQALKRLVILLIVHQLDRLLDSDVSNHLSDLKKNGVVGRIFENNLFVSQEHF